VRVAAKLPLLQPEERLGNDAVANHGMGGDDD
jgi:hypothetical protein